MRLEVREIEMAASADESSGFDEQIAIAEALESLPPLQRAMLTFVAFDDLSVADAGRLIGKSHAAAQSLLQRDATVSAARTAGRKRHERPVD